MSEVIDRTQEVTERLLAKLDREDDRELVEPLEYMLELHELNKVHRQTIATLTERVKELVAFYNKHVGTPCEQIRHQQEVEKLTEQVAELETAHGFTGGTFAELYALRERVRKLEHRLEIDIAYDQDFNEIVIPPEQRDKHPDGIYCRDETIRLMQERIDQLEAELARVKGAV